MGPGKSIGAVTHLRDVAPGFILTVFLFFLPCETMFSHILNIFR